MIAAGIPFKAADQTEYAVSALNAGLEHRETLIKATAGTDTHSICYEQHGKAEDIFAGKKIDPTFYPVIYGAEREDDWTDEAVWAKANPSLGITVPIEKVRQACTSAKQNPAEENTFRQLRLNQWVKQSVRWMPMRVWNNNDAPPLTCPIWRAGCVTAG